MASRDLHAEQFTRAVFLKVKAEEAISELKKVKGLSNFRVLDDYDRITLAELEEKNNYGVRACLDKEIILLFTHDSGFRDVPYPIVFQTKSSHLLPPVPFPELENRERKNVVSASPKQKVHFYLANKYNLDVAHEDATLLVGFDIGNS